MMRVHELKILPEYYEAVANCSKCFEVRFNDRDFKVNDWLRLKEYNSDTQSYTGRYLLKQVTYVLDDPNYCKEGYVILGIF